MPDVDGLEAELVAHLGADRLSNDVATALYRIVQESLTTIVKHAGAHHVGVLLTRNNGTIVTAIEADGHGLPLTGDSGIEGMRERVELLDGSLRVDSSDSGAAIVVEVSAR